MILLNLLPFHSPILSAVSTFKPVDEVDIHFRANTQWSVTRGPQETASQGSTLANSIECSVEIKVPENQKDLVRSVDNRKQECQKTIIGVTSESRFREPSSLSSGHKWEFERESRALAVWELCQNEHMVPSSITGTRATNQNSCNSNNDTETRNETTLLELPNDHETQHIHDLLKLLKNKQPYREETNKNVLYDIEFGWFNGLYGITDFDLVLACEDSVLASRSS